MEDEKNTLFNKLLAYSDSDYYPFHMPGHKRNKEYYLEGDNKSPYLYDITEIDGFDNLHHPQEIIKERLDEITEFYGSAASFYLVNGSTCGILAAISSAGEQKEKIIMARNSHKAAYNGLFLNNLEAEYIYPSYISKYGINGGICPQTVEEILSQQGEKIKEVGAVFITSPTYEGIVSDIESIAKITHKYGIPLIVDEAHGAHFGFDTYFPQSALTYGADIVIQSLHKTLPSLTQTAILHVNKNSLISSEIIQKYLAIYQSSSPSYVLMESIDRCMNIVMNEGRKLFALYSGRLQVVRKQLQNFKYFSLFYEKDNYEIFDCDRSKLVILVDSKYYSGKKLYDRLLEKYHLQMEMAAENYVIAMTSIFDTEEGFLRLLSALEETEREIRIGIRYREIYSDGNPIGVVGVMDGNSEKKLTLSNYLFEQKPVVCRKIRDASFEKYDMIELSAAKGKISQEYIYAYPPGVPILVPGEIISEQVIQLVQNYLRAGLSVQGMLDKTCQKIRVIKENWTPIHFW